MESFFSHSCRQTAQWDRNVLGLGVCARQPVEGAIVLVERLQDGLDGVDHRPVEFDLLADVPSQNTGCGSLQGLDESVDDARRPRIHRADGGDLGFGGVASAKDGHQVRQRDAAHPPCRVTRPHTFADFADYFGNLLGLEAGGSVIVCQVSSRSSSPSPWNRGRLSG